jgi:hypothetical protein
LFAAGLTVGLGWLSQVPYEPGGSEDAMIRLSWRARGARVEECRPLTAEELERIPRHMRREEICEGTVLPYRLRVVLNDQPAIDELVRSAGARQDRPLFVLQELPVPAGTHHLFLEFIRQGEPSGDDEPATPGHLTLDAIIALGPHEVALVTYDPERRELILMGYGGNTAAAAVGGAGGGVVHN